MIYYGLHYFNLRISTTDSHKERAAAELLAELIQSSKLLYFVNISSVPMNNDDSSLSTFMYDLRIKGIHKIALRTNTLAEG